MTAPARVPPHDAEAEAAMLSAILIDASVLDLVIGALKPEHFYSEANRWIYTAAVDLASTGSPVDIVTVASWLRDHDRLAQVGGAGYIAEIADAVPFVAHAETYAGTIRDKARVRQLIATCSKIAAEGYGEIGDVQEFVDGAEQAIFEIGQQHSGSRLKRIREVTGPAWKQFELAKVRHGMTGFPTGLDALDSLIGGLHRKQFTLVGARTTMGKTALSMNIGVRLADMGFGVAVFSPEMTSEELTQRAACSEARTSMTRALRGTMTDFEFAGLAEGMNRINSLPLWIDDTPGPTLLDIRAGVRRVKSECAAEGRILVLVVIDGMHLVKGNRTRNMTREEEVATIARGCKVLCKDEDVALIGVAQLSRELEKRPNKRPILSDLRESGELEQSADNVIFIYRDEYYNEDSEDKGLAELGIGKQRQGPRGPGVVAKVAFSGSCVRFDNAAEQI